MKKIGILTFHFANNYGAILQAFALKEVLINMGYAVEYINLYYKPSLLKRIYLELRANYVNKSINWMEFKKSREKYIQPLTPYYSYKTSKQADCHNYHAVIVGSDQVWRMSFSHIGYGYFFDFISNKNTKKISYAASFGSREWQESPETTKHVNSLLHKFHRVSVREASGVEICEKIFGISAKHVLDPTLLLGADNYIKAYLDGYKSKIDYRNVVVSYLLGVNSDVIKKASCYSRKNHYEYMDLYHISNNDSKEFGIVNRQHIRLEEWVYAIKNARYVITNSFHATVFSILFKKQFVILEFNGHRSSRIESLLNSLGIHDRFIDVNELENFTFVDDINYDTVHTKICELRKNSLNFITEALQ